MHLETNRLDRWRNVPLSYNEVGATAGRLPDGYRHVRIRADLGAGTATYERAVDLLLSWDMHRRAGLDPIATEPTAVVGAVLVQRIQLGPVRVHAPCRVIDARRTADRAGFTYGTLVGHPETGEEAFGIERIAGDRVVATITAFSRPGRWFTRLAGPVGDLVQDLALRRYLAALRSA